jgi:hypothetical protein
MKSLIKQRHSLVRPDIFPGDTERMIQQYMRNAYTNGYREATQRLD